MSTFKTGIRRAAVAVFAASIFAVHAEPQVEAAAKAVEAAAAEVTTIINAMTTAQIAKDAKPRLTEAFKKYNAADTAMQAAFAKAKPKNEAEGKAMEKSMEQVQKAASSISDATVKATERTGVGGEVGSAMKAAEAPGVKKQ